MRINTRFEYKYVLSLDRYWLIKNALMPYLERDAYAAKSRDGKYFVRSLYYDTFQLQAFHEREEGQFGRIKLRVRTYTDTPNEDTAVSFELKTKRGIAMQKYSALVPVQRYDEFVEQRRFNLDSGPILEEFARLWHVRKLEPMVLIEYEREAYVAKDRSSVRVTFDHDVRSIRAKHLYGSFPMMRPHRPKTIILEIKCTMEQPAWLRRMVKKYDLKVVTNSKYVQGIEIIRPMMVTPNWDVETR